MKNNILNVSDYIKNEYRDYSIHTILHRAIPLFSDGLKPVQRKILYAATKECPTKLVKVNTLAGSLPKIAGYHHGGASAEEAIVKMAQSFNNNIELLEGEGAFGTRPVPDAAAPRYISVRLSPNYNKFLKDSDVLPLSLDEEEHPEPITYLPLIPFSLVNGISGIAVGVATKILPRNPSELAEACKEYLVSGSISSELKPYLRGFRGLVENENDPNKYIVKGAFTRAGNKVHITEVPLDFTHERYIQHLDSLRQDSNPIITGYVDNSDSNFEFEVKLSKKGSTLSDDEISKKFKLESKFAENITLVTFDDNSRLPDDNSQFMVKSYDAVHNVVREFVDFRLMFFQERINFNINRCDQEIIDIKNRIDFIEAVLDGTIVIKDKTRKDLIKELTARYDADTAEKLVTIQIYSFTKDNIQRMKKKLSEITKELKYWKSANPKSLYIKELEDII